jgi:hypothetical protein
MKTSIKIICSVPILVCFVILAQGFVTNSPSEIGSENLTHSIAPMLTSSKTTFETVTNTMERQGLKVFLPTWLPNDLKQTVAYATIKNNSVQGVSIFLFSSKGAEQIEVAELTLEVYSSETLPFDPKTTSTGQFIKINGYNAFIYEKAPVSLPEYNKLFGSTARLVSIQIGTNNYLFRGAPSISMEDMIKIAESLR